jgi:hypothetical protein
MTSYMTDDQTWLQRLYCEGTASSACTLSSTWSQEHAAECYTRLGYLHICAQQGETATHMLTSALTGSRS